MQRYDKMSSILYHGPMMLITEPLAGAQTASNQAILDRRKKRTNDNPEMIAWLERYRGCDYGTWLGLVDYFARHNTSVSRNEFQLLISLSPYCQLVDGAGVVIGSQTVARGFSPDQLAYSRTALDHKLRDENWYVPYYLGRRLPRKARQHPEQFPPYPQVPQCSRYEIEVSASGEQMAAVKKYTEDRAIYERAVNDAMFVPWVYTKIILYMSWLVLKGVLMVVGVLLAIASVVGIIAIAMGAGKTPVDKARRRGLVEGAVAGAVVGGYATRRQSR